MTYREMAIETINIACKDLMERAEKLIPDTEGITGVDLVLHIPSLTDDSNVLPTITIQTDAYTSRVAAEKIAMMFYENK